jgi:hypothetical protein
VKKVDLSVIQQNIKIFSFFYVLIAIGVALLLTTPKVHANVSNCYSIQNSDAKNSCLALAKHQDSYCYSIRESDAKKSPVPAKKMKAPTKTTPRKKNH